MIKYFDEGNRAEFFRHWNQHISSDVVASDPSLKSLEFLLHAHFAIYFIRANCSVKVKNELILQS